MVYEQIAAEVADSVLVVTLDRPERLNAFTERMAAELLDVLDRADGDDSVRAVIVTGRGRAFCAGADLGAGAATFDNAQRGAGFPEGMRDSGGVVALRIHECRKPVIAAVNGPAVGIGATMTLPMDIRLASTSARFGFVFTRRGIVPEACSTWFLPRLVGLGQAMTWMATGRIFDAAEALAGGLVTALHEPGELLGAAHALAREIAENTSAVSVALTRRMLRAGLEMDTPEQAHIVESRALAAMGRSADAAEGVTAFLEKRAPRFPMRVGDGLPEVGLT